MSFPRWDTSLQCVGCGQFIDNQRSFRLHCFSNFIVLATTLEFAISPLCLLSSTADCTKLLKHFLGFYSTKRCNSVQKAPVQVTKKVWEWSVYRFGTWRFKSKFPEVETLLLFLRRTSSLYHQYHSCSLDCFWGLKGSEHNWLPFCLVVQCRIEHSRLLFHFFVSSNSW